MDKIKKEKDWQLLKSEPAIDLNIVKIRHDYYKNPRNEKTVKVIAIEGNKNIFLPEIIGPPIHKIIHLS